MSYTEYQTVTANVAALPDAIVDVDSSADSVDVTLPAPNLGTRVLVWRRTGGNLVSVSTSDSIEGASTAYITASGRKVTLVGTGSTWLIESAGRSNVSQMMGDFYVS